MKTALIFARAFTRREPLFSDPRTDCFRLFHGTADGIERKLVEPLAGVTYHAVAATILGDQYEEWYESTTTRTYVERPADQPAG